MCGKPPNAPQLPAFPGLSTDEQAILDKEGLTLDQFNKLIQGSSTALNQNKLVLQQISGLYDAQGNLDQNALTSLKSRTQAQLTQAQGVGSSALGYLQNYFGGTTASASTPGATPPGGTTTGTGAPSVADAQSAAYTAALSGTGAVNEATKQRQARDFQTLKDSLAQRGIMVTGDTPEQATSDSTAGQRALQIFQQNVSAENSQERLGYIGTLGGQVANTVNAASGAAGAGSAATNATLGYANTAATQSLSTLTPYLSQYQQGLNMYYQPYQTQQLGPYQQALDQSQMNYTAGLNQYNAGENQLMGWGQIGSQLLGSAMKQGSGTTTMSTVGSMG